jgi:NAD(P)-dependent dehydrogenase (short-subunit alcohol dehydrogenase family)
MTILKRAVITGASQGLGAHLAQRLAGSGWDVTSLGRRPDGPKLDGVGRYLAVDLADSGALSGLVDRVGGVPDLLVHCAVTYPPPGLGRPAPDEIERTMRVNALAPYALTADMLAAKDDDAPFCCVVVNSEAIYHAGNASGVYAASKAALRVLTTALADSCAGRKASVASLVLGPLASPGKVDQLRRLAERQQVSEEEMTRIFLRRSNPDLVIRELIDFNAVYRSVCYVYDLGPVANGMMVRLDGGSAGSLV